MGGFGADIDAMHKAKQDISDVRGNIDHAVSTLQSQIEPLRGVWKSDAARVFFQLMDQFKGNADVVSRKLDEIGTAIDASGKNYQAQDEEHKSQMNSLIGETLNPPS